MTPYWQNGLVTIYHGDYKEVISSLEKKFSTIIADPPYGDTSLEWDDLQGAWPTTVFEACEESASLWCFGSFRMFYGLQLDPWKLSQDLIWEKHNGSSFHADRFRRVHEHVVHFYKGAWGELYKNPVKTNDATARTVRRKKRPPHMGHIEAGAYESFDGGPKLMRSVIEVRSCHGYAIHPTQKPIGILDPLIEYSCAPGSTVLDPFMGSGSTLEACRKAGIVCVGIEREEKYCEAATRRLCV